MVPRAAVLVRPRFVPNDTLLTDLGCRPTTTAGWLSTPPGAPASPGSGRVGNAVLRAFVLATIAVPIVTCGIVPRLHRATAAPVATGRLTPADR